MNDGLNTLSGGSEMPKASASPSKSEDTTSAEVEEQKKAIIELSNNSVLHGYDMAIEVLVTQGMTDAIKVLATNRAIIEVGLKNGISERY